MVTKQRYDWVAYGRVGYKTSIESTSFMYKIQCKFKENLYHHTITVVTNNLLQDLHIQVVVVMQRFQRGGPLLPQTLPESVLC